MIKAPIFPLSLLPSTKAPRLLQSEEYDGEQTKTTARPILHYLQHTVDELSTTTELSLWLSEDEISVIINVFISELVLRFYPAIKSLTPNYLSSRDNQAMLIRLFENVRIIRNNVILRGKRLLNVFRSEAMLSEEVNFKRMCTRLRSELRSKLVPKQLIEDAIMGVKIRDLEVPKVVNPFAVDIMQIQEAATLTPLQLTTSDAMKAFSQRERLVQGIKRTLETEQHVQLMNDERIRLKAMTQLQVSARLKQSKQHPSYMDADHPWSKANNATVTGSTLTTDSDSSVSDSELQEIIHSKTLNDNAILLSSIQRSKRMHRIASPDRKHRMRYLKSRYIEQMQNHIDYNVLDRTIPHSQCEPTMFRENNILAPAQAHLAEMQSMEMIKSADALTFSIRDSNIDQESGVSNSDDGLDVQLVRAKEVEELYEEIMASVVDDHLIAVEPPRGKMYPFIPLQNSVDVSEVIVTQQENKPLLESAKKRGKFLVIDDEIAGKRATNQARGFSATALHKSERGYSRDYSSLLKGDGKNNDTKIRAKSVGTVARNVESIKDGLRTTSQARVQLMTRQASQHEIHVYADEFVHNRTEAMKKVPSSRIATLKYNFGGFVPQSVTRVRQRVLSPTDYREFLKIRRSDFLYHVLYSKLVAEEEAELERQKLMMAAEDKEENVELNEHSMAFERGFWNTMALDMLPIPDVSKQPTPIAQTASKPLWKENFPTLKPKTQRISEILANSDSGDETNVEGGIKKLLPYSVDTYSFGLATNDEMHRKDRNEGNTLQRRLENIWMQMHMPVQERLNMALKYASDHYIAKQEEFLEEWESAVKAVVKREEIFQELKIYEWRIYDLERFFLHGHEGSSKRRMEEAQRREEILTRLHACDASVRECLNRVKGICRDTVTWRGRAYVEKMQHDYLEMLSEISRDSHSPPISLKHS